MTPEDLITNLTAWLTVIATILPPLLLIWQTIALHLARKDVKLVRNDMKQLELNTNSKMDKVLVAAKGQARAEGELQGRKDEKADQATAPEPIPVVIKQDDESPVPVKAIP